MAQIPWGQAPRTGNAEVDKFLDDVLAAIKNLGAQPVAEVTQTATAAYGPNEQDMLNNLKASVNAMRGNI